MTTEAPQTFHGGVFSDELADGRCGVTIHLAPEGVCGTTSTGRTFLVRYSECQLEAGGSHGRMLFCRTPDRSLTLFCDDRRFPRELAVAAGGLLDEQLASCSRGKAAARFMTVLLGLILTAAGALLLVAGFYGIRLAADASLTAVPLEVDRQIGKNAYRLMDRAGPEVQDPVITNAVQQIVDRLSEHAAEEGLTFEVHVIDADVCNAYCLPGGTIVLYTGLLQRAASAEEVASVLAHEMAHATLRHGLRQVTQSVGLAAAVNLLVGNMEGLVVAGAEVFKLATLNSYSREQETAADAEGVRMLHAAAIDPMSLARFFETMQREAGDLPAALTWLSTHPDHAARMAAVRTQVATLPASQYRVLEIDWGDVQQRAGGH